MYERSTKGRNQKDSLNATSMRCIRSARGGEKMWNAVVGELRSFGTGRSRASVNAVTASVDVEKPTTTSRPTRIRRKISIPEQLPYKYEVVTVEGAL